MRVAIGDPVWQKIRYAMYREGRSVHRLPSPSAILNWISEEYQIEFIRDEIGQWIDTEIPDDIYTMLVLKYG